MIKTQAEVVCCDNTWLIAQSSPLKTPRVNTTMPNPYVDIFRENSRPLEPIATDAAPVLKRLKGIKAVMFDVYGTLIISASGEVGTAAERSTGKAATPAEAIEGAFAACDIPLFGQSANIKANCDAVARLFFQAIESSHSSSQAEGVDYPEVDILEIWRSVLDKLADYMVIEEPVADDCDMKRLAVEYEARVNPCWPMPGLQKCLEDLQQAGKTTGIISNAQFFTPLVFKALTDKTFEKLGFRAGLQYYSYRSGFAKPGTGLFDLAVEGLAALGISPGETIFVGNDMLNDVLPAHVVGFNTALFAGDNRSLRCREGDPRVDKISPDLVLTDLDQLADCV